MSCNGCGTSVCSFAQVGVVNGSGASAEGTAAVVKQREKKRKIII